jgi:CopG family nickel-responsive transcriptional regulator
MQRVTISLDDELLTELDSFAAARGYANRSEAVRDLVRSGLQQLDTRNPADRECVATLAYVYDHRARELAGRLTDRFHAHHHLALATMHVHLDHDSCLEMAVLRGPTAEVRRFGEQVIAERGVVHGRLLSVPAQLSTERHTHGTTGAHAHAHMRVRDH